MYCILVAGMPASGKSTIAVRISESLGIPMLSKDSIKEVLFDNLGFHSRAEKVQLGTAAMHILYYAAAQLMKVGKPFILENNFAYLYYGDFFENIHAAQSLFAQNSSLQICAFRCRRVQSPESPLCMELHRPEAVRAGAFSRIPCLRCEIAHPSGSAFLYLARDKIPPAGTAPAGGMTRSGRRCWRCSAAPGSGTIRSGRQAIRFSDITNVTICKQRLPCRRTRLSAHAGAHICAM